MTRGLGKACEPPAAHDILPVQAEAREASLHRDSEAELEGARIEQRWVGAGGHRKQAPPLPERNDVGLFGVTRFLAVLQRLRAGRFPAWEAAGLRLGRLGALRRRLRPRCMRCLMPSNIEVIDVTEKLVSPKGPQ